MLGIISVLFVAALLAWVLREYKGPPPVVAVAALALGLLGPSPALAQVYQWRQLPDDAGVLALLQDGRQVGVYYVLEDVYRARLANGAWSPPMTSCVLPIKPPKRNFGVAENHLHLGSHYSLNGRTVERNVIEQVLQESGVKPRQVEDQKIPDDSRKQRLTVIGPRAQTEPVLRDFQSSEHLRPFKDKFLVTAYEPSHWSIQRQGFRTTGQPTIYVQDVDGTVLHRQDDYEGGAEALARALRQIDPEYRPEKDKDRRKIFPLLKLPTLPWGLLAVLGLAAMVLVLYRKK